MFFLVKLILLTIGVSLCWININFILHIQNCKKKQMNISFAFISLGLDMLNFFVIFSFHYRDSVIQNYLELEPLEQKKSPENVCGIVCTEFAVLSNRGFHPVSKDIPNGHFKNQGQIYASKLFFCFCLNQSGFTEIWHLFYPS